MLLDLLQTRAVKPDLLVLQQRGHKAPIKAKRTPLRLRTELNTVNLFILSYTFLLDGQNSSTTSTATRTAVYKAGMVSNGVNSSAKPGLNPAMRGYSPSKLRFKLQGNQSQ